MTDEEAEKLYEQREWAERLVHELSEELSEYEEDSTAWQECHMALSDAENELYFIQSSLEDGGWQ